MGKNISKIFRWEPRPLQPHSCYATAGALMTLCQMYFFSAGLIEKSRVARSNVNWFLFVFLPGAGDALAYVLRACECFCMILCLYVCLRATFVFVNIRLPICSNGFCSCVVSVLFVNTREKARNIQESWLVAILYSFSMRLIVLPPASTLRKHIVTMQKLVKMTTTSSFYACF